MRTSLVIKAEAEAAVTALRVVILVPSLEGVLVGVLVGVVVMGVMGW